MVLEDCLPLIAAKHPSLELSLMGGQHTLKALSQAGSQVGVAQHGRLVHEAEDPSENAAKPFLACLLEMVWLEPSD